MPHLIEQEKADLIAQIPPYQRDARTKGIPALGSGAGDPDVWIYDLGRDLASLNHPNIAHRFMVSKKCPMGLRPL